MERKMSALRPAALSRMILSAMMAALIAASSQIAVPLPLVPINLALLAVMMTGFLLKSAGPWPA